MTTPAAEYEDAMKEQRARLAQFTGSREAEDAVLEFALSESVAKPLCGATDGPWSARPFEFSRLTCHECQALVLNPADVPA